MRVNNPNVTVCIAYLMPFLLFELLQGEKPCAKRKKPSFFLRVSHLAKISSTTAYVGHSTRAT